ncbi:MAG: hypothetical protein JSU87_08300 [Gemmatimonadota bacterium]|nr:MAG: hypothetical protein JSU87_08300 [Gemmatimonadota bacterium]
MRIAKVLAPLLIVFLIDACWSLTHSNWEEIDPRAMDLATTRPLWVSPRDSSAVMLTAGLAKGDSLIGWLNDGVRVSYPWERIEKVHRKSDSLTL